MTWHRIISYVYFLHCVYITGYGSGEMTGWLCSSVVVFTWSAKGPGIEPRSSHNFCNRWKIVARPGLEPRAFRWPCKHYHWATEPPVISSPTFHLNSTLVTHTLWLYIDFLTFLSEILPLNYRYQYLLCS